MKEGEASGGFAVLIVRAFFARAAVGTGTHPKTQEQLRDPTNWNMFGVARVDSGNWDKLLCGER